MAGEKDSHVVEIPVDEEHRLKTVTPTSAICAVESHPLMEISESPGHLLLLKLWQREEDLSGRRIAMRESRLDAIGRELFQTSSLFFLFHVFFLIVLFTSYSDEHRGDSCRRSWIPTVLSLSTSLVFLFLVQVKLCRYWKVYEQLQRERTDGRALARCIQELRMKGSSFDLSKEPQIGKRMKSSSVEIKWKPLEFCSKYVLTICLISFAGLVALACRFILCV